MNFPMEDSKTDLLKLAYVDRAWLPRCRFRLIEEFCTDLSFDSHESLSTFRDLTTAGICSLLSHHYRSLTIALAPEGLPSSRGPESSPWAFLEAITVVDSVTVNLGSVVSHPYSSTFPWKKLASWNTLTGVTFGGTLPSLATVALVITALPQLQELDIDATYLDDSIPEAKGSLSSHFVSFSLGSRGYALFSWLASLDDTGLYLGNVMLNVGWGDVSPLHAFTSRHSDAINSLTITLSRDRVTDLVPALKNLRDLSDVEFYLNYHSAQGHSQCIQSLASSLASASPETLTVYMPELPDGLMGAMRLQRLAKASMTFTAGPGWLHVRFNVIC
ncbi:hypothetical protein FA13DRAFT_1717855 [Coprinellus micaceus]|uniref:F-box domain-containing protein n=1 Tax=Coprinellus micaceus TaxID=71717 RepID=A0A4Y7SFG0_COPMI|nr:hypothetical protein FA13DRAFT_1717855 [Coprinellus micaceus]